MFDEALEEIHRRTVIFSGIFGFGAIAELRMQVGRQPGDDAVVQVEQDDVYAATMVQLPFDPVLGSADRQMLFDGEVTELICLYETTPSSSSTALSATITTAWNGNSMELTTTSSGVERPKRFVSESSTV